MEKTTYCDLEFIKTSYEGVHGYLSLTVCIIGSLTNIINIFVLKTKQMRTPTNLILIGLAIADLLVMLEYVPFVMHRYLSTEKAYASHFSIEWAKFYIFHAYFGQVAHFTSCCLAIILATWRYVYVSITSSCKSMCSSSEKTIFVIMMTYFVCPIICIPVLITLEVRNYPVPCDDSGAIISSKQIEGQEVNYELHNETIWLIRTHDPHSVALWVYSFLLKLLPCILLTFLFYKIIAVLIETRRRRRKILEKSNLTKIIVQGKNTNNIYKEIQSDRTTRMLLTVLILFILTEFPQAVLGTISALYGEIFLEECYAPLGDIMDILALTNSSINFVLYCLMSRQFRITFSELFLSKIVQIYQIKEGQINKTEEIEVRDQVDTFKTTYS